MKSISIKSNVMYILHSPLMDWIITLDYPGNLPETFLGWKRRAVCGEPGAC